MTNEENMEELARLIESAEMEQMLHPADTAAQRATRILEDASAVAAMSIVNISRTAGNEQLRFKASAYILEHVLGDVKTRGGSAVKSPIEEAFEGIVIPNDISALAKREGKE